MFQKLEAVEARYVELESLLADPRVIADRAKYQLYARERSELEPLITTFREHRRVSQEIEDSQVLLGEEDEELRELARSEVGQLKEQLARLEERLKMLLLPKDPRDEKNILLEIRAGTGGEEASLFAADLFRM